MARIARKSVDARLATTTSNLRGKGILAANESLSLDRTGSDRYPWRVIVVRTNDTTTTYRRDFTSATTWHGAVTAVDALYELSWHDPNA